MLASTGEPTGLAGADRTLTLSDGELRGPPARACARASAAPPSGAARRRVSMLELEGVVKHYRAAGEEVRAVDGVSLRVGAGEMVALQGPTGSGKTTLLLLIAGLLRPDAGAIRFAGGDLARLSDDRGCRTT